MCSLSYAFEVLNFNASHLVKITGNYKLPALTSLQPPGRHGLWLQAQSGVPAGRQNSELLGVSTELIPRLMHQMVLDWTSFDRRLNEGGRESTNSNGTSEMPAAGWFFLMERSPPAAFRNKSKPGRTPFQRAGNYSFLALLCLTRSCKSVI